MVDAIGSTLSAQTSSLMRSGLNQDDLVRLFLAQLSFQDPLEPVNNREFLAQMAQFANLEQSRQSNESMQNLVFMNSTAQSIGLLGREIEYVGNGGPTTGTITAVEFTPSGPNLSVKDSSGNVVTDVRLSHVRLVRF